MAKKKAPPKASSVQDVTVKELTLAYKRINGAPARRLRWLLDFVCYTDLNSLSEGRFADLRWEVVVFGLNRKPEQLKDRHEIYFDYIPLTLPLTVDLESVKTDYIKFQQQLAAEQQRGAHPELVKKFQRTMREAFDTLFKPAWWEVTRPSAVERIALDIKTEKGAWFAQNPPAFTGHDILLMQAIDLIKSERQRLKICQNPLCQKRFVAAKKGRAFFHSQKCSAYIRVNKARGIDVAARYREIGNTMKQIIENDPFMKKT